MAHLSYRDPVSPKNAPIAGLRLRRGNGSGSSHINAYFECFNQGRFYEAHDVLEQLWLPQRTRPGAKFYKGLIQLAAAFVHLQRHCAKYPRLHPAAALFQLARANLVPFQPRHAGLELASVLALIDEWQAQLAAHDFKINPWTPARSPQLPPRRPEHS